MKYLKLFEENKSYYKISNNEWNEFDILYYKMNDYIKILEILKKINIINNDQFYDIVDTLKQNPWEFSFLYHNDIYIYKEVIEFDQISIYKGKDDYFYINIIDDGDGNNINYKCDQFEGLKQCLKYLSNFIYNRLF